MPAPVALGTVGEGDALGTVRTPAPQHSPQPPPPSSGFPPTFSRYPEPADPAPRTPELPPRSLCSAAIRHCQSPALSRQGRSSTPGCPGEGAGRGQPRLHSVYSHSDIYFVSFTPSVHQLMLVVMAMLSHLTHNSSLQTHTTTRQQSQKDPSDLQDAPRGGNPAPGSCGWKGLQGWMRQLLGVLPGHTAPAAAGPHVTSSATTSRPPGTADAAPCAPLPALQPGTGEGPRDDLRGTCPGPEHSQSPLRPLLGVLPQRPESQAGPGHGSGRVCALWTGWAGAAASPRHRPGCCHSQAPLPARRTPGCRFQHTPSLS